MKAPLLSCTGLFFGRRSFAPTHYGQGLSRKRVETLKAGRCARADDFSLILAYITESMGQRAIKVVGITLG